MCTLIFIIVVFFLYKNVFKEADSIIYDFYGKATTRVQLSSILCHIEHGGLKAPHLESIIKTQKLCCKESRQ